MTLRLKSTLLLASVLLGGCETYNLERPRANLDMQKQTELINRSEVIAVVGSADIATDLEQQAAHWGYDLKRKEALDGLDLYLLTFDCPPGIDPHVASLELERLQPQSTVEANHKYKLQTAKNTVSYIKDQTPRKYANSLINWPDDGCDSLFTIGVIDGGVDATSLKKDGSSNIISRKFMAGNEASEARAHGTAIAEILIGVGRLKNAKLYNASVISEDSAGVQYSGVEPMLKALNWMVQSNVRIVNISLAGPYNRTLDRGIQRAIGKGVIIVAAVGNQGAQSEPLYPAAYEGVIAATAVDSDAQIYSKAVQGKHVDVSAPGVEVFIGDDASGRYVSGTSIAAPFVVAKIAADPRYSAVKTAGDVREILMAEIVDLGEVGVDDVYGAGLIHGNNSCHR